MNERRVDLLEGRGKSTSPLRKAPRGTEVDDDMGMASDMSHAHRAFQHAPPTCTSTAPRRTWFERPSSAPPAPRGRAADKGAEPIVMFKVPELATSSAARARWTSLHAHHLPRDLPRPADAHPRLPRPCDGGIQRRGRHYPVPRRNGWTWGQVHEAKRRRRPGRRRPHIKRRGTALHLEFEVLGRKLGGESQAGASGQRPTAIHDVLCEAPHHGADQVDGQGQLERLRHEGGNQEEPGVPDEAKAVLQELLGSPAP